MEDARETREVIMSIQKVSAFMDPVLKFTTVGSILLVTFLARMVKEKLLDSGSVTNFSSFCKQCDGEYTIVNIPLETKDTVSVPSKPLSGFRYNKGIADELKDMGMSVCQMPDLNKNDGYIQIAVSNKDKQNFSAWYENYLRSHMKGGEHSMDELNRMTNNHTSIVSIPFEGKEETFVNDFNTLQINYSILPDLRVGDGEIQLVVANTDIQKVQQWYQLYQKQQLRNGTEVPDLQQIDMSAYTNTGRMSEEEYVDTASEKLKDANQKYEREEGTFEKDVKESLGNEIRSEDENAYWQYESDMSYQKFTINKETLVDQMPNNYRDAWEERGFFASRVPGTFGDQVQYLLVEKDQVFRSLDGKTYTAFFRKGTKPVMMDYAGNLISREKRPVTEKLFDAHYDLSKKEQNLTEQFRNHAMGKSVKAPSNPIKIR